MVSKDPRNKRSQEIQIKYPLLPDTGASRTIFSSEIIRKTGTKIDRSRANLYNLTNASKSQMRVEGEATIYVTPTHGSKKGITLPLRGIVSSDLKGEILLGWSDCDKWGLLSKEYHDSCAQAVSANKPYSSAYQKSFSEEIPNPEPPKEPKISNNKKKQKRGYR